MQTDQMASLLAQAPMFAEVDPPTLALVADASRRRTLRKREILFHEGDPGDCLFVVADGRIKLFRTSPEGKSMIVATLTRPDSFGELAVIDGGPRSTSAEALEPTTLVCVARSAVMDLLRTNPSMAESLLRLVGRHLRRSVEQSADLVFLDLHSRVAKLLLALAGQAPLGEAPLSVDLGMTQADFAAMAGASRQSLNQILQAFVRRGFVRLEGQQIVLERPDQLRRLAGP